MKVYFRLIFVIIFSFQLTAQEFTDSNLPIVIITTDIDPTTGNSADIPDEPKVLADMKVIARPDGARNFVTDQNNEDFLEYSGRIGIETRGSTSQFSPKKPYGLTTLEADNESNNNVSILGMPKENDWILNSLAFDKSLIRDYLSYGLARGIGNYASRGEFCEVIINGDYKGLYIFMEKLKIDSDRIDILKIKDSNNDFPEVTGGFITKSDKTTGGDPIAWSYQTDISDVVDFIHERPKPEDVTMQQASYIKGVFDDLLSTSNSSNASITNGYPSIIDIPSFVDFMLINEIASNVDAYQFSTFFHKDRNDKLRAGPVWDFNLTFGNDLFMIGLDRSFTNVWQFDNGDNVGAPFWRNLFANATFNCYLSKRWSEITSVNQPLNYTSIDNEINALVALLSEARIREDARWGTLSGYELEIANLKSWIQERITWMTTNIGSLANCTFPTAPSIVISEINYNPADTSTLESDDLEFITLSNNSDSEIALTGFYFRALGVGYQFPEGAALAANDKLFLASDSDAFLALYGFSPFGIFTRNLSNKQQQLVLTDAFGNTIDNVIYEDKAPWPDADGTGAYLVLEDLNSDNMDPENWTAVNFTLSIDTPAIAAKTTKIYPNPIVDKVVITNNTHAIDQVAIYDLLGRLMATTNTSSNRVEIPTSELSSNTYLVEITLKNGNSVFRKVVKQ